MEALFFMGLVTPLIQFCRVISSGMVKPSCSQSSLDEYCLVCRVLSSLSVSKRLARLYQHTSVLDIEVTLRFHGRRAWLSPRAMT